MQIEPNAIDPDAAKVIQRLRRYDHAAYLVGGCVRDLLLGAANPKTSTSSPARRPNDIRRLFKNCRIIGRRFRLAHIFFGPKIIETSTFRANPREMEEEEGGGDSAETESGDLLIRRDNVFGTPEQDARRRDFTINGLFYDLETQAGHRPREPASPIWRRASSAPSAIPTSVFARTRSASCARSSSPRAAISPSSPRPTGG